MQRPGPTPALAELHAHDLALGVDPLEIRRTPDPPVVLGPPLTIEPADFDGANLQTVGVVGDTQPAPAKPGARRWTAEQLRPDRKDHEP
jgi:hypothetical protein